MISGPTTAVRASNELTARWCERAITGDTVLSGAGVWPLIALLAAAADEPAAAELRAAAGAGADPGREALELIELLAGSTSASAALGIWVQEQLPIRSEWAATLPRDVLQKLTGQAQLDAWAARHTDGLVPKFPLQVTPEDMLVLATALVAKTRWRQPFEPISARPDDGPWRGTRYRALQRESADLDDVDVISAGSTSLSRVRVAGDNDLDVHLLIGDGEPSSVLVTGIAALSDTFDINPARALPDGSAGPGLTVRVETASARTDLVRVSLPPFEIHSSHDLSTNAGLFGLRAAMDHGRGNLSRISSVPLALDRAAQDAVAIFSAEGFEAAAVTAVAVRVSAMFPTHKHRVRVIEARFDRPFGFLAVHRPSALVVAAGWIARPG